jgi:hypothetical protein
MKLKKFMVMDKRKMSLFILFIFIFILFHIVLFVLATANISGIIYSMVYAYIFIPLFVIDLLIQNPIFYGTPLWLLIFYITTIVYLYLLSYLIIWIYDKFLKGKKK